jgi:hypothetical protein
MATMSFHALQSLVTAASDRRRCTLVAMTVTQGKDW